MRASKASWVKPILQMRSLTIMDMVVIVDYYQVTTIDENMNWMKLTRLLSISFSKPQGPLLYIYLTSKSLITILNVYTREK